MIVKTVILKTEMVETEMVETEIVETEMVSAEAARLGRTPGLNGYLCSIRSSVIRSAHV